MENESLIEEQIGSQLVCSGGRTIPNFLWNILPKGEPSLNVLEIGIGRGFYGFLLHSKYKQVHIVGIDRYKPFLDHLSTVNLYDELLLWDLNIGLPQSVYPLEQYDLVLGTEVLEHLDSYDAVNRLLADCVKAQACFFTVPNNRPLVQPEVEHYGFYHKLRFKPEFFREYGFNTKIVVNRKISSRVVRAFAKVYFAVRGCAFKEAENIVAWKGLNEK